MAGKKTLKLRTRDVGQIAVICNNTGTITGPSRFVVSLNSDFDRKQSAQDKDRKQASLHASEDNLRVIQFSSGGTAKKVQIEQPINSATNKSVENKKVRSWRSKSPSQRFRFGQKLNLPITLHVEGINKSKNQDDIVYRFVFFDKDDRGVCEGELQGTVVKVTGKLKVEDGVKSLQKFKKMLILGQGKTEATLEPNVPFTVAWSYPGGTFAPATQLNTTFTAGRIFTPDAQRDQQVLILRLTSREGHIIEAHSALNLTAPRSVSVKKPARFPVVAPKKPGKFLDANKGAFSLFRKSITYTIQDQFGNPIEESTYAGKKVYIRENIGIILTSGIAEIQTWITNTLRWSQNWRIPGTRGQINDRLRIQEVPKSVITRDIPRPGGGGSNQLEFHPPLQARSGQMMATGGPDHHIWFLTVDQLEDADIRVAATHNPFSVTVADTQGRRPQDGGTGLKIRLRSEYQVVLP